MSKRNRIQPYDDSYLLRRSIIPASHGHHGYAPRYHPQYYNKKNDNDLSSIDESVQKAEPAPAVEKLDVQSSVQQVIRDANND